MAVAEVPAEHHCAEILAFAQVVVVLVVARQRAVHQGIERATVRVHPAECEGEVNRDLDFLFGLVQPLELQVIHRAERA